MTPSTIPPALRQNVVVDMNGPAPVLKICDLGASINELNSVPRTQVGTPAYMPPEVRLQALPGQVYSGEKADVFSAGVLLYLCLFRQHAFWTRQHGELLARLQAGQWQIPQGAEGLVSPECLELLRGMLQADPAQRIQIADILARPWFNVDLPGFVAEAIGLPLVEEKDLGEGVQTPQQIDALLHLARYGAPAGEGLAQPREALPMDDVEEDDGDDFAQQMAQEEAILG